MNSNPLRQVQALGQSIWLDLLKRSLITSGELKRLVEEDGLCGVTSNPKIFDDAIEGSDDYDADLATLAGAGKSVLEIYEALAIKDIQSAADVLRVVYDHNSGRDGFVSLEVNPHLANDTSGTILEARRLWAAVNRPNVCIKIPATKEGVPAIEQCLTDGININVTLLFGLERYREVAIAYLNALETRAEQGKPIDRLASVASFFLSRIDALLDPRLEELFESKGPTSEYAERAIGRVAIANAKLAYQIYRELFGGDRFQRLADLGAREQRVLWASTSTKNPAYNDVMYVEALIGPSTVNTMPLETLNAYRDHGKPEARLERDVETARKLINMLPGLGIDMAKVAQDLEEEGVKKFNAPFDKLLKSLESKQGTVRVGA